MKINRHRILFTWIFSVLWFVFFVYVFVFSPDVLPEYRYRMLAISTSLLASLTAFFFSGDILVKITSVKSQFGQFCITAGAGFAMFFIVMWWWSTPFSPIKLSHILLDVPAEESVIDKEYENARNGPTNDEDGYSGSSDGMPKIPSEFDGLKKPEPRDGVAFNLIVPSSLSNPDHILINGKDAYASGYVSKEFLNVIEFNLPYKYSSLRIIITKGRVSCEDQVAITENIGHFNCE